jgi:hypothetical protein
LSHSTSTNSYNKRKKLNQVWWYKLVIPELEQEDHEFKDNLAT